MVDSSDRVPIEPQSILAPLSRAAIFLVVSIGGTADAVRKVRGVIADIGGLLRTVGFRDLQGRLSCNVAIGSAAWDRFGQPRRPAQLRPFAEIRGPAHTAVATPGDLLFHIRANRADMCFELERLILEALGDAVTVADEVHGFRYFDSRDLLGFVDGTENPTGADLTQSALIQSEDPAFAGGSYVVVQKYLHKLDKWRALETATQENIIGRTKPDNVELEELGAGIAQDADDHRRRARHRARYSSRQHAVRQSRSRRVRHLFHRLYEKSLGHRKNAGEYVRRRRRGPLRSAIGFLDADDRDNVLCAVLFDAQRSWLSGDRCSEPQQTFIFVQSGPIIEAPLDGPAPARIYDG